MNIIYFTLALLVCALLLGLPSHYTISYCFIIIATAVKNNGLRSTIKTTLAVKLTAKKQLKIRAILFDS